MTNELQSGKPQRGAQSSVERIRTYLDIWEKEGTKLGRIDGLLKLLSLLASAAVATYGTSVPAQALASLGLIAFAGNAIPAAFRLAKKSDTYWRAWRMVNSALISFDAEELGFEKLVETHRMAEHLFEDWAVDGKTPRS